MVVRPACFWCRLQLYFACDSETPFVLLVIGTGFPRHFARLLNRNMSWPSILSPKYLVELADVLLASKKSGVCSSSQFFVVAGNRRSPKFSCAPSRLHDIPRSSPCQAGISSRTSDHPLTPPRPDLRGRARDDLLAVSSSSSHIRRHCVEQDLNNPLLESRSRPTGLFFGENDTTTIRRQTNNFFW